MERRVPVKTTVLIIEYLFAGILVLLALILLTIVLFPQLQSALGKLSGAHATLDAIAPILAVILTAIAYGTGLVAEFVGGEIFEWWLKRIKRVRLTKYLRDNYANLRKSPILAAYAETAPDRIAVSKDMAELIGVMRFCVLMQSQRLYQEIESQLNRFRLIRVLFLVEVILALAIIWRLFHAPSLPLVYCLVLVLLTVVANAAVVGRRFHRYCRAVERAYKVLVLDQ